MSKQCIHGDDPRVCISCEMLAKKLSAAQPTGEAGTERIHKRTRGGNDYISCDDCGQEWDYRKPGAEPLTCERVSSPRNQHPDFKTVDIAIRDLGELAEMLREKQHEPTGFDHSIALRLDQISQTLRSVEPSPRSAEARNDLLKQIYLTLQKSKAVPFAEFDAKGTDFALGELMDKMLKIAALPGQPSPAPEYCQCRIINAHQITDGECLICGKPPRPSQPSEGLEQIATEIRNEFSSRLGRAAIPMIVSILARHFSGGKGAAVERQPDGYAYRYYDCIRFNQGELVNLAKPIEAIPYYFKKPPLSADVAQVPNSLAASADTGKEQPVCNRKRAGLGELPSAESGGPGGKADCCGDAHLELEAAFVMLADIGFERETIQRDGYKETVWRNKYMPVSGGSEGPRCPKCGTDGEVSGSCTHISCKQCGFYAAREAFFCPISESNGEPKGDRND